MNDPQPHNLRGGLYPPPPPGGLTYKDFIPGELASGELAGDRGRKRVLVNNEKIKL